MRPTVRFISLARNAGRVIKPPSTPVKVTLEVIRSEVSQWRRSSWKTENGIYLGPLWWRSYGQRVYDLLPSRSELETEDEKNQNIERVQFPSDKQMKLWMMWSITAKHTAVLTRKISNIAAFFNLNIYFREQCQEGRKLILDGHFLIVLTLL